MQTQRQFTLRFLLVVSLILSLTLGWWSDRSARLAEMQKQNRTFAKEQGKVRHGMESLTSRLAAQVQANANLSSKLSRLREANSVLGKRILQLSDSDGDSLAEDDAGYLTVDHPTMVYVRRIPTEEPMTWKYRIYLPPSRLFVLQHTEISAHSKSTASSVLRETGRMTLTVSLLQHSKESEVRVSAFGSWWLSEDTSQRVGRLASEQLQSDFTQQQLKSDQPIDLLRLTELDAMGQETGIAVTIIEHSGAD